MYPEIFHIGPFALRSFGLTLAISFFVGLFYVARRARREGVDQNFIINLAFIEIFSGVLGARLFFVLFHLSEFASDPLSAINPFGAGGQFGISGLNLYGGVVCAIIAAFAYIKAKKQRILQTLDIFAPSLALGIFITRIGCFLNGCCFGIPTNLPFCVHFPEGSIPYSFFGSQCLHPTQLYSSFYGLILFFALHRIDKSKKYYGVTFAYLLMFEAIFRFAIEYVRYYEPEMIVSIAGISMTYNHIIAVALFLLGLIVRLRLRGAVTVTDA